MKQPSSATGESSTLKIEIQGECVSELVERYDSQSEAYREAFDVFLRHTDQKLTARQWLEQLVGGLPHRGVFIDAGAGEGTTTAWMAGRFGRTIAVEPNAFLRERLAMSCPDAQVIPHAILDARPEAQADFVLCSHVFYYLPDDTWQSNLDQLRSWLAPGGALVLVMQNPGSDCMRTLPGFFGQRASLGDLLKGFEESPSAGFTARIDTVPCYVNAPDFETAYKISEFMVNAPPDAQALARSELEDCIRSKFLQPDGRYKFSCTQDFLEIRRD